jgi:hypothetical protein
MGDDKPAELATSRAAVTGGPSLERGRPDGVTVESQPKKEASLGRGDSEWHVFPRRCRPYGARAFKEIL